MPCFVSSRDPNYIQLLDAHVHWSTRKNTCLPLSGTGWLILFLPLIIFIFRPQLFQRLVQRCSQPVTLHWSGMGKSRAITCNLAPRAPSRFLVSRLSYLLPEDVIRLVVCRA